MIASPLVQCLRKTPNPATAAEAAGLAAVITTMRRISKLEELCYLLKFGALEAGSEGMGLTSFRCAAKLDGIMPSL